jgi:hypothetical protein
MRKILAACAVALALVLATGQQASAWHKCSFGVGLNIGFEGGGNCLFWGLLKGAPAPGQMDGNFSGGDFGSASGFDPGFAGPQDFSKPLPMPPAPEKIGAPIVKPAAYYYNSPYQSMGYYANPYQPMSYYPYSYPAYPMYYTR